MTKPRRNFPRVLAKTGDRTAIRANGREGATLIRLIEKGTVGVTGVTGTGCELH